MEVTKRTFHAIIHFSDGIMANSVDYLIEAHSFEEASRLRDKLVKKEQKQAVTSEDRYQIYAGDLKEYKSYTELVDLLQVIKADHNISMHSLITGVDMCVEEDNSSKCTEGCDGVVGVDYGEPKIEVNGSEMSARHIGTCEHGVVILDRTEVYKLKGEELPVKSYRDDFAPHEAHGIKEAITELRTAINLTDMMVSEKTDLRGYLNKIEAYLA